MPLRACAYCAAVLIVGASCARPTSLDSLAAELLEMGRRDQDVRGRLIALVRDVGTSALETQEFRRLAAEQAEIDEANFARLEEIVAEHGWPTAEDVGERANNVAWLILEHADIDRQRRYLTTLRDTVTHGLADGAKLAALEDEVAIADDGLQIYGTEIKVDLVSGAARVAPVAEPERLDERRASLGLIPMEEYLRQAEAELGIAVDRSALRSR